MKRYSVKFDREAAHDLAGIRDFLAGVRDETFANAFVERIISYCESFGTLPKRGSMRDDLYPGLRTLGWRKTITLAFLVDDPNERVLVLGVFYRGRDVVTAIQQRRSKESG